MKVLFILFGSVSVTLEPQWAALDKSGARNSSVKFSFSQTAFYYRFMCVCVCAREEQEGV